MLVGGRGAARMVAAIVVVAGAIGGPSSDTVGPVFLQVVP